MTYKLYRIDPHWNGDHWDATGSECDRYEGDVELLRVDDRSVCDVFDVPLPARLVVIRLDDYFLIIDDRGMPAGKLVPR